MKLRLEAEYIRLVAVALAVLVVPVVLVAPVGLVVPAVVGL